MAPGLPASLVTGLALLGSGLAAAAPSGGGNGAAEVGFGYESQSAPLVRLTPQGTLVRLDGVARLAGSHERINLGGMHDWPLADGLRLALSGDLHVKHSPQSRDLDFVNAAVNPMLRWSALGGFLGLGPNVQHIAVAGRHFRDAVSFHADWTQADDGGSHWMLMADVGRNRHRGDLVDLDSTSAMLLLQRHLAAPLPGIDGFDIDLSLARERNDRRFPELSSRNLMVRLGLERRQWEVTWSVGASGQWARFDDTPLATLSRRRDQSLILEAGAERELAPGRSLRLEWTTARNRANLPLYENRYRQVALGFNWAW